ncbi:thioredoxin domain-containing protein [Arthrobacter sp. M4]|uniref:thioredoxin domain-containing protein n=1 Tax=Arthrobacter sp. M4 TaxID=218160 RepID=UPI001CDCDFB6|nr:thioredoxin domain-containing protein [Arthrobacter sp. M4]MCA4133552.1 thioredoxin domain-containing protein [Arthrobacter sp. M4]
MRTAQPAEQPRSGGFNALGSEPSAYLRQHADNPVHWQPFGDEAFALAASRDVPVFLSIGYAACHWCHVMAHESFEDQETADYLNRHFVSIKVDREERPDVDAVYMAATQAISGEGGWPMSVFLTSDGLAFHAGTYFPPKPQPGRPSFRQVLEAVWEAWVERRDAVERNAHGLAGNLAEAHRAAAVQLDGPPLDVEPRLLSDAVRVLARSEDPDVGGFGSAPKFPPSAVLEFLIRHAAVESNTVDSARGMAGRTLAAMARSALFDQLDGGFARYSVTADWSVPHFEKMLYDNAQLLRVYAHWIRLGGGPDLAAHEAADIATRTAEWLLHSMGLGPAEKPAAGGFASSLDADTVVNGVHHEGAVYLWTPEQLVQALGPGDGAAVAKLMGVGQVGTVSELGSPLHPGEALEGPAARLWARVRPQLLAFRNGRVQPDRDDKVVAGWNGLAVAALAEAGAILGDPRLVTAAVDAAEYLAKVHWNPGKTGHGWLARVSHEGEARGIGGLLEDYAFAAEGFLALYAVTGEERWYSLATDIADAAIAAFAPGGRLADTTGESAHVLNAQGQFTGLDPFDGPTPSGAAAFAGVLLTLSAYSGSHHYRSMAGSILSLLPPIVTRAPRIAGWLLATAQAAVAGPVEAAVVGPDGRDRQELHRALLTSSSPGLVVAVGTGDGGTPAVPLLEGRVPARDGGPQVFLCRDMVCDLPVRTVEDLRGRLREMGGLAES